MDIIIKEFDEKIYVPDSLNHIINNEKYCFFDIETTGFNRITDKVVLIGITYIDNNKLIIKQFFANDLNEEKELLIKFKDFIKDFKILINYNGDTFDIPFLNSKYNIHNINFQINLESSLDILKIIRKNKNYLSLENNKLKTVERYLGINRDDKISGRESVKLYKEYIKNKDNTIKDIILKHNFDDIYFLPTVLKIFDIIDKKSKVTFNLIYNNKDFLFEFNLDSVNINSNIFRISGTTSISDLPEEIHFTENYSLKWNPSIGELSLNLEVYEGKLSTGEKCIYLDKEIYPFNINFYDKSSFKVPNNIVLLKIKDLIIENITQLLKETLCKILLGE